MRLLTGLAFIILGHLTHGWISGAYWVLGMVWIIASFWSKP